MEEALELILRHKYLVLFAFVFAEQIGLPLPALPVLLAAGALVRVGELDLWLALATAVAASVLSDVAWYQVGRRQGGRVLNLLCRISLEPDSCVRRTEQLFARHGARSLVVAKFVPGYNTVAPPLAGMFGLKLGRFLFYDALGALLWIGTFAGLGFLFGKPIERLLTRAAEVGAPVVAGLVGLFGLYLVFKVVARQRFLAELRLARISPEELHAKIAAGEEVVVVDLRHALDFEAAPETVPGAHHLPVEEFDARRSEIPLGPEVVLFCT